MVKRKKLPRTIVKSKTRTGKTNIRKDRRLKALPAGKRLSKSGRVYYENRRNRSDKKGVDTPLTRKQRGKLKRKLAKRGVVKKRVVKKITGKRKVIKKPQPKRYSSFSAGTILKQLGGNRFIAMTGAKHFVKDDNKRLISFKIGRNAKGVNYVTIKLTSMDLYDMSFLSIRAGKIKVKSTSKGLYNDMLQDAFTRHTGMYTHL